MNEELQREIARIDLATTLVPSLAVLVVALLAASACAVAAGDPRPASGPGEPGDTAPGAPGAPGAGDGSFIRVNQVGYLPEGPKVAVVCSLEETEIARFTVVAEGGDVALEGRARAGAGFGPCARTHRLDFSALREPGRYRVLAAGATSRPVRIGRDVYAGAADTLLMYMRQQRSGFNPLFGDSVHHRTDAILVDHPRAGELIPVAGGWHDAADYLQYVTTSATATYTLLAAYRDHPHAFADLHQADGTAGANGIPDVLDEARHGLEWLVAMYPEEGLLLNQIADDRDHRVWSLPTTDSADYGWGPGGYRPVYPCTGRPQGLFDHQNRSDGYASTAGKFASAMALGAQLLGGLDPAFADTLAGKAASAYELGRRHPGVCQTAPARAPYFYEEENWVDDMELAAAQLHALTGEDRYLREAVEFARQEPVTPWMGEDTARHYQWYPWHNNGHYEIWREAGPETRDLMVDYYRQGLERVAARAHNGFRVGVPFIWCSNDLMASFATQASLYRRMTGDGTFREHEQAALDWIFGTNPWGASMVIGYPADGNSTDDPHSVIARELGAWTQTGGLLDGPVYRSIYESLLHIQLYRPDRYAAFNTGHIVYHDDFGDYSTNEPIMDGTANLVYMAAAMVPPSPVGTAPPPADAVTGDPRRPAAPAAPGPDGVRVVVMSDLNSSYGSTDYDPEVGHAVRRTVREWRPDLVLIAGDMVAGQDPDLDDDRVRAMWAAFDSVVAEPLRRAGIPFAFTLGNHDASGHPAHGRDRRIATERWRDRLPEVRVLDDHHYPFYYAFAHRDAFFLVLDASTGGVVADSAQMAWIRRTLDRPEARLAKLRVSMGHVPLYAVARGRNRPGEVQASPDSLRRILEDGGVRLHISGHHHAYFPGRRGQLDLLHAGALGQGPRPLLAGDAPPSKTLTLLDLFPAADSMAERTLRVRDHRFTPLDPATLPHRIEGITGVVLRREVREPGIGSQVPGAR